MHRNFARLALAATALAPLALVAAQPARADDPKDPAMRTAAARARDRELIRQLNLGQLAAVRERDEAYAVGWAAARAAGGSQRAEAAYAERSRSHRQALADYATAQADYERRMAGWRRQVDACNAGDRDACR